MNNKSFTLLQGSVLVPEDFIVVKQTKTEASNYAGIVAEKNGSLPHYLVFSDTPISEYSAEDEDRLYAMLEEIYPEVAEVRKQEVEAVFEDGKVVNAEEWKSAPRLGLFAVNEVQDMNHLYFGTGIVRAAED